MRVTIGDSKFHNFMGEQAVPKLESVKISNPDYWNGMSPERKRIHDSNFVMLQNSLAKIDNTIYKPKLFITYGDDLPIEEGGGLVDYVSYITADWSGITSEIDNIFSNQANYVPRVNAGFDQHAIKVYTYEVAYDIRFVDLEKSNKAQLPQSIEQAYKEVVLAGFDIFCNRIAYEGVGGTGGLFTSDKVQTHQISAKLDDLDTLTDAQMLSLLNGMLSIYLDPATMNLDTVPTEMLVPTQFGRNLSQRTSELYARSLRNYFIENNVLKDEMEANGIKDYRLNIKIRPMLDKYEKIVLYRKHADYVKLHIPYAVQQLHTGINMDKFAYTTLYVGQVSEVQMPYNQSEDKFGAVNYWAFQE